MANTDIRLAAMQSGVKLYQIAHRLGICDNNFSRKLRYELPQEKKDEIFAIINELAKEG